MGVDARVVFLAGSTSSDKILYPTEADLMDLNVITKTGFSDWVMEPYGDGLVAISER